MDEVAAAEIIDSRLNTHLKIFAISREELEVLKLHLAPVENYILRLTTTNMDVDCPFCIRRDSNSFCGPERHFKGCCDVYEHALKT